MCTQYSKKKLCNARRSKVQLIHVLRYSINVFIYKNIVETPIEVSKDVSIPITEDMNMSSEMNAELSFFLESNQLEVKGLEEMDESEINKFERHFLDEDEADTNDDIVYP